MDKKPRGSKTTKEQYKYYVDFLESNVALRTNKYSPENPNQLEEAYDELAIGLNAIGGPQRSANAWQKIMADWRCITKTKAREIASFKIKTGGGPPNKKILSDIENKLLDTIGRVVVDGVPETIEAGLPLTEVNSVESIEKEQEELCSTILIDYEDEEPASKIARQDTLSFEPARKNEQMSRRKQAKSRKRPVEIVTDAYEENQKHNRRTISALVKELQVIKESINKLACAQEKSAKIKLAKLKLQYPNAKLDDLE